MLDAYNYPARENSRCPDPAGYLCTSRNGIDLESIFHTGDCDFWALPSRVELFRLIERLCQVLHVGVAIIPAIGIASISPHVDFLQALHALHNIHIEVSKVSAVVHVQHELSNGQELSICEVGKHGILAADCVKSEVDIDVGLSLDHGVSLAAGGLKVWGIDGQGFTPSFVVYVEQCRWWKIGTKSLLDSGDWLEWEVEGLVCWARAGNCDDSRS